MFGKRALENFCRLSFANKSKWLLFGRAYILLIQVVLLATSLLFHFSEGRIEWVCQRIIHNGLIQLEFASVFLHTLVCSVIGMDKVYILHLIWSGIYRHVLVFYYTFLSKDFDYMRLATIILTTFMYWIFNIRTRILYLSQFRFAVTNANIDNRTLFRRLFKWWILMHLIFVAYKVWDLFQPNDILTRLGGWHFLRALWALYELKMYLALTPDIDNWCYIFSKRSCPLEKFYIFCILFHISSCLTFFLTTATVTTQVNHLLQIVGEMLWAIRWFWLYFYAKEKMEYFIFQCIDADSSSGFFDEFEFVSKAINSWESIGEYEPEQSLDIINI